MVVEGIGIVGIALTQNRAGPHSVVTVFLITVYFCSRALFFLSTLLGDLSLFPHTMLGIFTYLFLFVFAIPF